MGIVLGRIARRLLVRLVTVGGILYVEYRVVLGGPPIRKLYKEIKDTRLKREAEKAKREGKIIVLKDYQVV